MITMVPLPKPMAKLGLSRNQTNYISFDTSYPKNVLSLEFGTLCQNVMGINVKFSRVLPCRLTKYGHITRLKLQISKIFNFLLISTFDIRKVTKLHNF